MNEGRILAIGGLSRETSTPLFEFMLAQAGAREPRVGFLPTASGDAPGWISRFYEIFEPLSCRASHLELFGRAPDPAAFVDRQDVILVGGGNTKSMLAVWHAWGLDAALRDAWNEGALLAGFSAGAICWFATGLSDSWEDRVGPVAGLDLLPGVCCPHYDSEPERRTALHRFLLESEPDSSAGIGIDDHCAVLFSGRSVGQIFSAVPNASAHRVERRGNAIHEEPLEIGALARASRPT